MVVTEAPEGAKGCAGNEPLSYVENTRIETAHQGPNELTESQPPAEEYLIQRDPSGAESYLGVIAGAEQNQKQGNNEGATPGGKTPPPAWARNRQLEMPQVAQHYRQEVRSALGLEGPAMYREGELLRAACAVATRC